MKLGMKSVIWIIRKQKTHNVNTKKGKQSKKSQDSVRSLWDNFKHSNMHIMGVPEREERDQEIKNLFEKIMIENFPNLVKKTTSPGNTESQTR